MTKVYFLAGLQATGVFIATVNKARYLHKLKLKCLATTATLDAQCELKIVFYHDNSLNREKNGVKISHFFRKLDEKCGNEENEHLKIYLQFI